MLVFMFQLQKENNPLLKSVTGLGPGLVSMSEDNINTISKYHKKAKFMKLFLNPTNIKL